MKVVFENIPVVKRDEKRRRGGEVIVRVFHSRLQRYITDSRDYLCDLTMAVT